MAEQKLAGTKSAVIRLQAPLLKQKAEEAERRVQRGSDKFRYRNISGPLTRGTRRPGRGADPRGCEACLAVLRRDCLGDHCLVVGHHALELARSNSIAAGGQPVTESANPTLESTSERQMK